MDELVSQTYLYTKMSSCSTSHPKCHLRNIRLVMAKWICTIVENNFIKKKHLNGLKRNFKTYGYPEKIVEIEIHP